MPAGVGDVGDYLPARICGPLRGRPKRGAKMQKSKRPASSGTTPTMARMMPAVSLTTSRPKAMRTMPATMRAMRPVVEAIKLTNPFM